MPPVTDVEGVEVGEQGLITKWDNKKQTGFGLFINKSGSLEFKIGRGKGKTEIFSLSKPLFRKVWYRIYASFNSKSGEVSVSQHHFKILPKHAVLFAHASLKRQAFSRTQ